MSEVTIGCPHCQHQFKADSSEAGKVLVCPSCQKKLRAPVTPPAMPQINAQPQVTISPQNQSRIRKHNFIGQMVSTLSALASGVRTSGTTENGKVSKRLVAAVSVVVTVVLVGTCSICICSGIAVNVGQEFADSAEEARIREECRGLPITDEKLTTLIQDLQKVRGRSAGLRAARLIPSLIRKGCDVKNLRSMSAERRQRQMSNLSTEEMEVFVDLTIGAGSP